MKRLRLLALTLAAIPGSLAIVAEGHASDPGSPSDYYSLDGKQPTRFSSESCLFTICLGDPVRRARAVLGVEGSKFPLGNGTTAGNWSLPRKQSVISLTLTWDHPGSISELGLAIAGHHPSVRVALSHRLILGSSSMGDVRKRFPRIVKKSFSAQTTVFYEYRIRTGAKGSETVVFGYAATRSAPSDPRGFNAGLDRKPITNFKICYSRNNCP